VKFETIANKIRKKVLERTILTIDRSDKENETQESNKIIRTQPGNYI
jgi:hypothetical protein